MIEERNLIDGAWVQARDGATLEVRNPANDTLLGVVPSMGAVETNAAIAAAETALPAWKARPAHERASLLRVFAALVERDTEALARTMTLEQGKPIAEARGEINYARSFLEWSAGEAVRITGEMLPASTAAKRIFILRQPVGVCAAITPWNFPAAMITRKLGPALAAGCTMVVKPAEATPLTALALARLAVEAGMPPGVVGVITGDAATIAAEFVRHPAMRKLSFTGSTEVGRLLMAQSAPNLLRLSLELGGHAPFIVFDDCDLDAAVAGAIASKFRNAGQTCVCANRFYVQEAVQAKFIARFRDAVGALRVGPGIDPASQIGPLINDEAIAKVKEHVGDATGRGAQLAVGGGLRRLDGCANRFFEPTVLVGVTPEMLISREETFGPVAAVSTFRSEEEAVARANATPFGLAAYCYTRDLGRALRMSEALEFGVVGINDALPATAQAPFGGVKHSGFGREGGRAGVEAYLDLKYVSVGVG